MKTISIFLVLILAWSSLYALEQEVVMVRVQGIALPLNRFLLVKKGDFLGAVIFISYEKSAQGEFTSYRTYRYSPEGWREEEGGIIGMRGLSCWQRVLGKLGIHSTPLSRVKPLKLGGLTLLANPSQDGRKAAVHFGSSVDKLDPAVKLAPTPWRTIQEVNLKDARLKWYCAGGPELTVRIDELWR